MPRPIGRQRKNGGKSRAEGPQTPNSLPLTLQSGLAPVVRVTAWASPLPLDKAPYQPAPEAVAQLLFGNIIPSQAPLVAATTEGSNAYWLPLDASLGLAYYAGDVFVISLPSPTNGPTAHGYRSST